MSESPSDKVDLHRGNVKAAAGLSRMSLRKPEEDHFRMKLMHEARSTCLQTSQDFGKCIEEHGMLAIFKCRAENKRMNDCLNANYNEEVFKKYVNDLGYEFEITTKKDGLFR